MTSKIIRPGLSINITGYEIGNAFDCSFSFDTKFLFCPCENAISVFNVQSGRVCGQLVGHTDRVTSIIINERNHLQLISGSLDGFVVVWDVGAEYSAINVVNIKFPIYKVIQIKCLSNSFLVVAKDNKTGRFLIKECNTSSLDASDTAKALCSFGQYYPACLSYGYETNVIAGLESHRKVQAFNIITRTSVHITAPSFSEKFASIAVHPTDCNVVAVSTTIGRIYIWTKIFSQHHSAFNAPSFYLHWHAQPVRSIAFSPEGSFLFSGGEECVLVKWLWRKQQRSFLPRIGAPIAAIAVSPDSSVYALGLVDNSITLVSSNLSIIRSIRGFLTGSKIQALRERASVSQFSPVGLLYDRHSNSIVSNSRPGNLQFFNADNNQHSHLVDITSENYVSSPKLLPITEVVKASFTCDGLWLATVQCRSDRHGESALKIWRFDAEKTKSFQINTLSSRAHIGSPTSLRFSPSSDNYANLKLISTSQDGAFRIWRCRKKEGLKEDTESSFCYAWENTFSSSYHSLAILDSDWSADGSLLALAAGAHVLLVDGNADCDDSNMDVASAEDSSAASASGDDWLLATLTANSADRITGLRFGQQEDFSYLVACSSDGEGFLGVWNVKTLQLTWRTSFMLPLLVSNPFLSTMAVISATALQQKEVLLLQPSSPSLDNCLKFDLPVPCSDDVASTISPIEGAVFVPVNAEKNSENSSDPIFNCSKLYLSTANQKLYVVCSSNEARQVSQEESGEKFKFLSPSIVHTGNVQQSSLASFLSLHATVAQTSQSSIRNESSSSLTGHFDPKSSSQLDSLYDLPTHLLPPVDRLCSEFLLRRCIECYGCSDTKSTSETKHEATPMQVEGQTTGIANSGNTSSATEHQHSTTDTSWITSLM